MIRQGALENLQCDRLHGKTGPGLDQFDSQAVGQEIRRRRTGRLHIEFLQDLKRESSAGSSKQLTGRVALCLILGPGQSRINQDIGVKEYQGGAICGRARRPGAANLLP